MHFSALRLFILVPMTKSGAWISIKCCGRVQNVFVSSVLARAPFSDSMGFTAPIYSPKCVSEWSNVIMVSHGPMELFYPAYILPYFASRRSNSFFLGPLRCIFIMNMFCKDWDIPFLSHSESACQQSSVGTNWLIPSHSPSAHNVDRDAAIASSRPNTLN